MLETANNGDSQVTQNIFTSTDRLSIEKKDWSSLSAAISKDSQPLPEGMATSSELLNDVEEAPPPRASSKEVTGNVVKALLAVGADQSQSNTDSLMKALKEFSAAEKAADLDEHIARLHRAAKDNNLRIVVNEDGSFSVEVGNGDRGTINHLITVMKDGKLSVGSKLNGAFVPGYQKGSLSEAIEAIANSAKNKK